MEDGHENMAVITVPRTLFFLKQHEHGSDREYTSMLAGVNV